MYIIAWELLIIADIILNCKNFFCFYRGQREPRDVCGERGKNVREMG